MIATLCCCTAFIYYFLIVPH
uniref:Uncharacterized protein n=1 Tax=Rhizophora mucronata TaxID=61149 RepID=A0A2P2P9Q0_RHIMU